MNTATAFPEPLQPLRLRPSFRDTIGLRLSSILSRGQPYTIPTTTNYQRISGTLAYIYQATVDLIIFLCNPDALQIYHYQPLPNHPENSPERIQHHNQILLDIINRFTAGLQEKVMDDFYILDRHPHEQEFSQELLTNLINEMILLYRTALEEINQAVTAYYDRPAVVRERIHRTFELINDAVAMHAEGFSSAASTPELR